MTLITWVWFFVGYIAGLFFVSFSLLQSLICFFFGIPTARRLTREGVFVHENPVAKQNAISGFVLLTIFVSVTFGAYLFAPSSLMVGYAISVVWTLLFGLGKIGANSNNMADFFATNRKYLSSKV